MFVGYFFLFFRDCFMHIEWRDKNASITCHTADM